MSHTERLKGVNDNPSRRLLVNAERDCEGKAQNVWIRLLPDTDTVLEPIYASQLAKGDLLVHQKVDNSVEATKVSVQYICTTYYVDKPALSFEFLSDSETSAKKVQLGTSTRVIQ